MPQQKEQKLCHITAGCHCHTAHGIEISFQTGADAPQRQQERHKPHCLRHRCALQELTAQRLGKSENASRHRHREQQTKPHRIPQDLRRTAAGLSQFLRNKTAGAEHGVSAGNHRRQIEKRPSKRQRPHRCRTHTPGHPGVEQQCQTLQKELDHGHLYRVPNYTSSAHLHSSFWKSLCAAENKHTPCRTIFPHGVIRFSFL